MTGGAVEKESCGSISSSLKECLQKFDGSLLPAIIEHVDSPEFSADKDCQDFLGVKNSLLLSYMIELSQNLLIRMDATAKSSETSTKLFEMKAALEKIRPLEKKMKYQLDKLLSENNSGTFASEGGQDDPLSFRPNSGAMKEDESSSGKSESDEEEMKNSGNTWANEDVDDDLIAARKTLKLAGDVKNERGEAEIYRAPRLQSTPYPSEGIDEEEKERRFNKKLRASELARTLREQYGEAPDQEDMHGGTDYGKQRDAARRLAEIEKEKIQYEEDNLVRLTTSRKHKKERKRLMREESSNLAAISDIGNIVRSVSVAFEDKPRVSPGQEGLSSSGKNRKRRGAVEAKNHLQKELFGTHRSSKKKKA